MPITTPRPSKRKHAEGGASGDGSAKKTKEERRAEKRAKREAEEASPIRKKEKVNGVGSVARTKTTAPKTSDTEFKLVRARAHVSLPPRFAGDARRGVEEILDNLVMRYVPSLRGVLLSHRSHSFAQSVALLYAEGPYPTTEVEFDAGVWAPEVGMRITGRISLHATDHIGLLVHRTFNVSISRTHIPGDGEFEYVHGPVANDPEINTEERQGDEESGRWINSQTGETLGGESGLVEFTVIGYTIANQMLSLHGSLQPDPFAPEHYTARQTTAQPNDSVQAEDDTDMADNRITEGSDDEVDAEDEDLAAPRGSKRKLVDIIPVAPEAQKEAGPAKKKKKKKAGVVNGEASVVVIETAAGAVERAGKKKSKKKKAAAAEADGVGA